MIVSIVLPARADWFPGDTYKMHYPQLPDPNGWDVNFGWPKVLADDWRCTETGPVSDIHFWYSFAFDQPMPINGIHLSIHDDVPASPTGGFSHPGNLLWSRDLLPTEWVNLYPYPGPGGTGVQGWYDPNTGEYLTGNHNLTGQINVRIPDAEAFIQEKDKIYWLDISVITDPVTFGGIGWKTSLEHFNDDAVWADYDPNGTLTGWQELRDPTTGQSLDLAFVITTIPEPGTLTLLGAGAIALAVVACRRRKV